jgi:N-formylglutamate deformylase
LDVYRLHRGEAPLIVSMPHVGTHLPAAIADTMTPIARHLIDTDWHVDRLYDMAPAMGATTIAATHSRYVVDLNRAPDDKPLYPGADNTELVPLTTFDHEPIYLPGQEPDQAEIARRVASYWSPYHACLAEEIARLAARHGRVVLWDGHSIRSQVPRFFEGRLTDFNLGTAAGASCDPELARRIEAEAAANNAFSSVLNGRFKGGYITRRFGRPAEGVHTIQLELSQITYMEEALPFRYLPEKADEAKALIARLLETALSWAAE